MTWYLHSLSYCALKICDLIPMLDHIYPRSCGSSQVKFTSIWMTTIYDFNLRVWPECKANRTPGPSKQVRQVKDTCNNCNINVLRMNMSLYTANLPCLSLHHRRQQFLVVAWPGLTSLLMVFRQNIGWSCNLPLLKTDLDTIKGRMFISFLV